MPDEVQGSAFIMRTRFRHAEAGAAGDDWGYQSDGYGDPASVRDEQLGKILQHAEDVEALDVGDVPPTAHPYPLRNVFRADEVRPSVDRDEVLAQAPAAEGGRFKVPPVLGEEP